MRNDALERATGEIGREIFSRMEKEKPRFWETSWWERRVVEWLTSDPEVKSRVLRFVDVYPSLKSDRAVARHIKEYLPDAAARLPEGLRVGGAIMKSALHAPAAASAATRAAMSRMAKKFIAGSSMEEMTERLDILLEAGMSYTVDILGEATLSDREADFYADSYLKLITYLAAGRAPGDPAASVSLKLSSLAPRFDPAAPEYAKTEALRRLRPILKAAAKTGSGVNIDMESFELRDLALEVFREILNDSSLDGWDGLGTVAQAYLKDSEESLDGLLGMIRDSGRRAAVRLVKGAYWDMEAVIASQRRWPLPTRESKAATDAAFERMTLKLLENTDHVTAAVASHNVRSIARAVAAARWMGAPEGRFEIQTLYGMADPVKKALVEMGVPVRVYAPFGEMIPGMAYLVRRLLENSSNESFLRRSLLEEASPEELLRDPAETPEQTAEKAEEENESKIFVNEPAPMFHEKSFRDALDETVEKTRAGLGKRYHPIIDGERIEANVSFSSTDPSNPSRIVGIISKAGADLAERAMNTALAAFGSWAALPAESRSEKLFKAAAIMRERKLGLAALQMFEVGKTRQEAVADVDEAIDHVMFNAAHAPALSKRERTNDVLGEVNTLRHRPRGPGVVIAPWNFPLAILAGMASAALAAGNTVVVKPSSNSAALAAVFMDILLEAGVSPGAAGFLPGPGPILGKALISHPATSFVMFTGSWETGSAIVEAAAVKRAGRRGFIKTFAEMGGKNAVIVDGSADLDEAVAGVVSSAFGFGGQKCSACSRVIALNDVYGDFVERLVAAAESLVVGPPSDPASFYGPLIDEAAVEKAGKYIRMGEKEATPLLVRKDVFEKGRFVPPALFGDVDPASSLARDEIFGPVLSVMRAKDMSRAIEIVNGSDYALTAGLYSRTPSSVEKLMEGIEAGNVYINRGITGAVVGRQPFGGFKKSGAGSAKAGSLALLKELSIPVAETENIVRHGFSPDIGS
ncbi:MAG: proline dehydrogenase family protein [Candidatus Nitrospinota bacterium M3_3B_026]